MLELGDQGFLTFNILCCGADLHKQRWLGSLCNESDQKFIQNLVGVSWIAENIMNALARSAQ